MLLLTLGLALHELCITGGFYFSHSELAGASTPQLLLSPPPPPGRYSGILFGITNTFAQIPGFLTPVLVSEMTQHVRAN